MKLRGLHPELRNNATWLLNYAESVGVPVTVTSVARSYQEQGVLRARFEECLQRGPVGPGREPGCRFPANRPGDSAHQPFQVQGATGALAWDSSVPDWAMSWWIDMRRWAGWEVFDHDNIHAQVPSWRRLT